MGSSGITGSGTAGRITKFTAAGSIGDSLLTETTSSISLPGSLSLVYPITSAMIIGDVSGNSRGANALDIQSLRSATTQVANGSESIAIGVRNTANPNSVAIGVDNNASYDHTIAIGVGNANGGRYGGVFGLSNVVTHDYGFAFGKSNSVNQDHSYAIGEGISNNTAGSFQFGPSDATKVTILSSGNVGIGTTGPTSLLEIRGVGGTSFSWGNAANQKGSLLWNGSGAILRAESGASLQIGANGTNSYMFIDTSGNVGIGTTGPSTKLHVLGSSAATIATFADGGATTCTVTPASTGFACSSDERLKKNIESFSDSTALENILQLRTVTYDWRSVDNGRHTGYIAQELEQVAPEFVRTGEDGFKQVNYTGLVPWITGAIKAFYAEFKVLSVVVKTSDENKSREIASVNSRADKLEAKDAAIMQENAELKARLEQQEKELTAQKQELAAIKNKLGL